MRRTNPTNSEGVAANNDNLMHRHVLEVAIDERSPLVQGIIEMIAEADNI
jgi:hypothetical protein